MKRKSPVRHQVTRNGKTFTRGKGSSGSKNAGKEFGKVKSGMSANELAFKYLKKYGSTSGSYQKTTPYMNHVFSQESEWKAHVKRHKNNLAASAKKHKNIKNYL